MTGSGTANGPGDELPELVGPYRILRKLGEGGMGAVYEALHEAIERRVAIKVLHPHYARLPEFTARFFNEARAVNRVEHPGLVQISDYGQLSDGMAYIIMELLSGESLAGRIRRSGGCLPLPEALNIGWQIAEALAAAHYKQVVHRDLKPDNLMLVADPIAPGRERVKLLDFGIAKLAQEYDGTGLKTNTHAVMGTPMYMSPEQCAGAGGVDAKSDVYSFGCVLYQMLCGRPPFYEGGPGQLIGQHLYEEPEALAVLAPQAPSAVIELVNRLLLKDKTLRPSMSETAEVLGYLFSQFTDAFTVVRLQPPSDTTADVMRQLPTPRQSTTLGQSIGQQSDHNFRRRRLMVAAVAALALTAVGATLWHGQPLGKSSAKRAVGMTAAAPPASTTLPPVLPPQAALSPSTVLGKVSSATLGAAIINEAGTGLGEETLATEHPAGSSRRTLRQRSDDSRHETQELGATAGATSQLTPRRHPWAKPPPGKPPRTGLRPPSPNSTRIIYEE